MRRRVQELDGVEFLRDLDGWPAGTRGAVIVTGPESAVVEVATEHLVDEEGLPLRSLSEDLVEADYDDLRVVSPLAARIR